MGSGSWCITIQCDNYPAQCAWECCVCAGMHRKEAGHEGDVRHEVHEQGPDHPQARGGECLPGG